MRKQRKPEPAIRRGSREVFEIVKSHWPVTSAEIIKLKHYRGSITMHAFQITQFVKAGVVLQFDPSRWHGGEEQRASMFRMLERRTWLSLSMRSP